MEKHVSYWDSISYVSLEESDRDGRYYCVMVKVNLGIDDVECASFPMVYDREVKRLYDFNYTFNKDDDKIAFVDTKGFMVILSTEPDEDDDDYDYIVKLLDMMNDKEMRNIIVEDVERAIVDALI